LLDGLHVRFQEPTNEDVLAFHEAFADIVALFQHFAIPEALRETIARTRGDLGKENLLAQLAVEFGRATGRKEGLRNAIGRYVDGRWTATPASPDALKGVTEPHARGAVLVAAVFDAFLKIYRVRTADLVRLATQGTGVLPEGDIPVDLVERLAGEASKVATHVLSICIRALDYCPPVDIKFGEYLRALITADRDLVPRDDRGYRVAFVSAFRDRGIYPAEVRNVSEGSLVWEPPPMPLQQESIERLVSQLSLGWDLTTNRYKAYLLSRENRIKMQRWLMNRAEVSDEEIAALGFSRGRRPTRMPVPGRLGRIEVHSLRPARRVGPDGHIQSDLVVEITQTFNAQQGSPFRGGCTLLIDLNRNEVRYFIRKRVDSVARFEDQQAFAMKTADDLRATYFAHPERGVEPFALLHRGY